MKKINRVNWQEKMKISASHFIQTENYYIEQMGDIRSMLVDRFNFGLLPMSTDDSRIDIQIREHISNHVEVILHNCNAVTASGERIEYFASPNSNPLSTTFSPLIEERRSGKSIANWDVILTVNQYERQPFGELNPTENPPRHPDCIGTLKLHVVPSDEINLAEFGSHFITIGKIRKEGERYAVDTNYIPPCCKMSSHAELRAYYMRFDSLLYSINKSSKDIVAKVYNRQQGSEL
ncbi:MAG: hypothetical protein RSF40_12030, partial [Oscillospiraceae bacterium]